MLLLPACWQPATPVQLTKVYKYDASIQCQDTAISLDEMMLELAAAGIEVVCAQQGHDGLFRPSVCGAGTGNLNIYQISEADLDTAEALGFERVSALDEYQDRACTND